MAKSARIETVRELCKHRLTAEEIAKLHDVLVEKNIELRRVEDEKSTVVSRFSSQIKEVRKVMNETVSTLTNGYEFRPTECAWVVNWDANKSELIRVDTGEIVRDREITDGERQLRLQEKKK